MRADLDRETKCLEVFDCIHQNKKGEFIDTRSQRTSELYATARHKSLLMHHQGLSLFPMKLYRYEYPMERNITIMGSMDA
ncbi:hypothetical protein O6P43_001773 [Quillaja saponaria]|uniref:Uncharacterized protein n=1 Tax=Quillaja saponaria TaxID=32244 RepID=A0AAD7QJI6_QUISA|nr:hypothetical protein O6P43_001773 [Quillaja saponaria]